MTYRDPQKRSERYVLRFYGTSFGVARYADTIARVDIEVPNSRQLKVEIRFEGQVS